MGSCVFFFFFFLPTCTGDTSRTEWVRNEFFKKDKCNSNNIERLVFGATFFKIWSMLWSVKQFQWTRVEEIWLEAASDLLLHICVWSCAITCNISTHSEESLTEKEVIYAIFMNGLISLPSPFYAFELEKVISFSKALQSRCWLNYNLFLATAILLRCINLKEDNVPYYHPAWKENIQQNKWKLFPGILGLPTCVLTRDLHVYFTPLKCVVITHSQHACYVLCFPNNPPGQ